MIILNPNSWLDALWWYEDEPEVYGFMIKNDVLIIEYAKEKNITIKNAIDLLFKRRL